jgi:hypothetical protein
MGDFSWLQFSDLHFSTRDSFDTGTARDALLQCLKDENSIATMFLSPAAYSI